MTTSPVARETKQNGSFPCCDEDMAFQPKFAKNCLLVLVVVKDLVSSRAEMKRVAFLSMVPMDLPVKPL